MPQSPHWRDPDRVDRDRGRESPRVQCRLWLETEWARPGLLVATVWFEEQAPDALPPYIQQHVYARGGRERWDLIERTVYDPQLVTPGGLAEAHEARCAALEADNGAPALAVDEVSTQAGSRQSAPKAQAGDK